MFRLSHTVWARLAGAWALAIAAAFASAAAQAQPAASPAAARAVIDRLASLGELPDGPWKVHAGDLPHGEALHLDERSWQSPADWRTSAHPPNEAVWFRQTYQVPETLKGYDLTGARIWFQFHSNPQILYFDGRRVAMGEDLEPMVLVDDARPGDKITVAVKVAHNVDIEHFRGATLRIEFPKGRPSPADVREELLSASALVPSLAPEDPSRMATLDAAYRSVDLAALDAHDQPRFDGSLKAAQAQLDVLKPLLRQGVVHLTGQSHIDAAWQWPWTETVDVVRRTFGTALQLMYEYPDYTYTQSAAAYYDWMAEKYPDLNAEIRRRIKEGRWEPVGGMWVEPDLNMPDGESLVRQLLVGKRWFKQAYGVDVRVGWNPDSFGFTAQLPQIYKKSGVDYFVTNKLSWNDTNHLPFSLFWWQSPDGSKVLTYFALGLNDNLDAVRLSHALATERQNDTGATHTMDLFGIGDHGGGPTRAILDEGARWASADKAVPRYEFGTAQSFFTEVEKEIAPQSPAWSYASIAKGYVPPLAVVGKVSIPTWTSDLYLETHRGVFTTQANQKRNMREAEVAVLDAEKWASLAWLSGQSYSAADLTEDWKKVLFNQFHDLLPGSGIGVIYKDAQRDFDVVRRSTDAIEAAALAGTVERIDTRPVSRAAAIPVVVFNSLGWPRSGPVTVEVQLSTPRPGLAALAVVDSSAGAVALASRVVANDAHSGVVKLRIEARDVPPLGYRVVYVLPNAVPKAAGARVSARQSPGSLTLEDAALRLVVDRTTGCITSLYDKRSRFESLALGACGNELQAFKDTPKDFDAWNIDPGTLDQAPARLDKADRIELVSSSDGPAIRIVRTWRSSKFVQTLSLTPGADQVDVDNEIDWQETHVLLKAAFPLAATAPFATFEIPYGAIERPTTRDNSWDQAQFEVPALRWGDLGDGRHGLSLINSSKYGYDAVGNLLRLTLLRAPTAPDPQADRGHHHFRYALYPHAGTWKTALTVRHGYDYNYPLAAVVTTAHAGPLPPQHSFASAAPENVVLTAVKKAEDTNSLIFRAYEWAGKDSTVNFRVPAGASGATLTNLMETPEGHPLAIAGDLVRAPIHPYEILTLRVDYPAAGPGKSSGH